MLSEDDHRLIDDDDLTEGRSKSGMSWHFCTAIRAASFTMSYSGCVLFVLDPFITLISGQSSINNDTGSSIIESCCGRPPVERTQSEKWRTHL